jgi:amino acid permease
MKEKKNFKYVIMIGSSVIATILIVFPLIMYLCYQDKTSEVIIIINFRLY